MTGDAITPAPILVIGLNRSGTKWLSNLIADSPDVFAVQSDFHTGILETNLLGPLADRWPRIVSEDDYAFLVEGWSRSDFFRHTGLSRSWLYELSPRPQTCSELLECVMRQAAVNQGCRFWLQKLSPIHASRHAELVGRSRIVTTRRDMASVVASSSALKSARGVFLRDVIRFIYESKLLSRIEKRSDAIVVSYDRLRTDQEQVTGEIYDRLGIRPPTSRREFRANTSFSDARQRQQRRGQMPFWLRALAQAMRLIPSPLLGIAYRAGRTKNSSLVRGTYHEAIEDAGSARP